MAHRELSAKDLEEIRELAQRWGKIVARHAFGEDGPGTEVDLDTMEQVARMATAGLTEGTLGTLLEQQAHRLGTQQPCPACGRLCPVQREERTLTVRAGPIHHNEPICHCLGCRRDFFPPTDPTSPGRPHLQPWRSPHDR